jgi:Rrf2 family transcriptional regulator, repressor of oqxAB
MLMEVVHMDDRILAGMGWFRIAVQALVVVAESDRACSSAAIAQVLKVHATFLRRVMVLLVRANIVDAHEGRDGGYRLARPAEAITLAEIYQAAKAACPADGTEARDIGSPRIQHLLDGVTEEIQQALLATLHSYTVASLLERPLSATSRS